MNKSLCAKCSGQEPENKFLPRPINDYREVILSRVCDFKCDDTDWRYPVFSNIAYNLQYLEYINRCFEEQYLTSVLRAQNVKMFTLTSSQIIECLLFLKLVEMGVDKNEIWDFGRALRTASDKNIYALGPNFYRSEMRRLKDLRNKVHLQSPLGMDEADYAVFEKLEVLNEIKLVLRSFLQKVLQMPGVQMDEIFYFLAPTKEFIHSKK